MAEIVLNNPEYFRSGESWPYAQVGNALSGSKAVPSVVRYSFKSPAAGARAVSLSFSKWYLETGAKVPLRFYIGTDPDSHIDADGSFPYTGELSVPESGPTIDGSGQILLLPGKDYYLWVFPSDGNFGIYSWENAQAAFISSGASGGGRIGEGKKLYLCAVGQPDGSKKLYLPCVYDAAAGKWKLQS